jgi:hypothetical protein
MRKLLIATLAACLTLCAQIVTPPVTAGGSGSGTVTSIVAGTGLSGGTITASGTIACLGATASQIGCSKPDNSTIKATAGVYAAQSITIDSVTCTPGGSCTAGVTQLTGDVTAGPGSGSQAATVVAINGTSLAGLATGLLTNTTSTGVPTITALPLAIANGGTGAATMAAYGVLNNATGSSAAPTVTANPVVTTITSHGSAATDSAALGTEMNGTCGGTGTVGAWTGTAPNFTAPGTAGQVLACTGFTSGSYYQTVTSIGAGGSGSVTVSIGGTQTAAASTGTLTAGLKANGTSLTFSAPSTYTGTIGISAKLITPISVFAYTATDSTGAASSVSTQTLASLHNYFSGGGGTYNTTGSSNGSGQGYQNLFYNTTGYNNGAAPGYQNLFNNTTGFYNGAGPGYQNLFSNTTGFENAAGPGAYNLFSNTTGANNGAGPGYQNLYSNTIGNFNVAGPGTNNLYNCGASGATCSNNVAAGYNAGRYSGVAQTTAMTSVNNSIFLGQIGGANATGDVNEIGICAVATTMANGSNTATIGCPLTTDLYAGTAANIHVAGLLHNAGTVYSAAGTALPACNSGELFAVLPASDITTLNAAYVSGGGISGWVECVYTVGTTTYSWNAL